MLWWNTTSCRLSLRSRSGLHHTRGSSLVLLLILFLILLAVLRIVLLLILLVKFRRHRARSFFGIASLDRHLSSFRAHHLAVLRQSLFPIGARAVFRAALRALSLKRVWIIFEQFLAFFFGLARHLSWGNFETPSLYRALLSELSSVLPPVVLRLRAETSTRFWV